MKYRHGLICFIVVAVFLFACQPPADKKKAVMDSLSQQAIDQLRQNLRTKPKLVKVHAAEFLLWLGLDENNEIHTIFLEENNKYGTESPYRVPLWRVLAQTETDSVKKEKWIDKILGAWMDTSATDRAHAAESLSKLKISLSKLQPELTSKVITSAPWPLSTYTFFSASVGITDPDSIRSNRAAFIGLLSSPDDRVKGIAAYAIRHLGGLIPSEWHQLGEASLKKLDQPLFQVYLSSSAYVTVPQDSVPTQLYNEIKYALLQNRYSPRKDDRMEMAAALALRGGNEDLPVLDSLLNNRYPVVSDADTSLANADIRSVASYAILKIKKRSEQTKK